MKKNKNTYLYLSFAILLLAIIPYTRKPIGRAVNFFTKPISSSLSSAGRPSGGLISGIFRISSLIRENSELTEKIKKLQIDKTELEELKHQNEVLKNQLGFMEEHKESSLLPARIIGREPFGILDKIIIDKGTDDGVNLKAAVVSNGALVGKVSEVSSGQAKITLITSKDSIVQAMLQNSRTLGIIKGSLEGVKLENIPQETQVLDDEAIVTSGLGGEISPGILIGWAKGASSTKSEIYKVLDLDIAEDLNKLEFVFIVK